MSELNELKLENKSLRKQLDRFYLTLYNQIDFYLRLHDLTIEQHQALTNQILQEFMQWKSEGKDVWDTIGDPKQYVEMKLIKYNIKRSWIILILLRRYTPLLIGFICLMIILLNTFNPFSLIMTEAYTFNLSNIYILDTFVTALFYIFVLLFSYWSLFKRDKKLIVYVVILFLVFTISKTVIRGLNETIMLELYIPSIYILITLGLSVLIKVIDRKKIWV